MTCLAICHSANSFKPTIIVLRGWVARRLVNQRKTAWTVCWVTVAIDSSKAGAKADRVGGEEDDAGVPVEARVHSQQVGYGAPWNPTKSGEQGREAGRTSEPVAIALVQEARGSFALALVEEDGCVGVVLEVFEIGGGGFAVDAGVIAAGWLARWPRVARLRCCRVPALPGRGGSVRHRLPG